MVTELRVCPACETPYNRHPQWRATRCPRCIGALGGALQSERSREALIRDPELAVMWSLTEAMDGLSTAARGRALTWLIARYGEAL